MGTVAQMGARVAKVRLFFSSFVVFLMLPRVLLLTQLFLCLGQASDQYNGISDASHRLHRKRKRHPGVASDDEEPDAYGNQITEEHYRTMLSEHVQKYRRSKAKEGPFGSDPRADVRQMIKHKNDHTRTVQYRIAAAPEFNGTGCISAYGGFNKIVASLDSSYLDMGDNVSYLIPEGYDKLAASLNLPVFSDLRVEEHFLNGTLDLRTLSAMLGTDRKFEATNRGGLAEPQPQHESLQERVKIQKFALQVTEDPFAIPEGSAGRIRRPIMSESGNLQVHYVKVLEKGDTYEVGLSC
jgi:DNA helicase INO80